MFGISFEFLIELLLNFYFVSIEFNVAVKFQFDTIEHFSSGHTAIRRPTEAETAKYFHLVRKIQV